MSDEEIKMFSRIYRDWQKSIPENERGMRIIERVNKGKIEINGIAEFALEQGLGWTQEEVRVTGESLAQLGLTQLTEPDLWGVTNLGLRLADFTLTAAHH